MFKRWGTHYPTPVSGHTVGVNVVGKRFKRWERNVGTQRGNKIEFLAPPSFFSQVFLLHCKY